MRDISKFDWITSLSDDYRQSIEYFFDAYDRLRARTMEEHVHALIDQAPFKAVGDEALENAWVSNDASVISDAAAPTLSKEWYRAFITQHGDLVRYFDRFTVSTTLAIVQLLDGLLIALERGDIIVAFLCARSIIENSCTVIRATDDIQGDLSKLNKDGDLNLRPDMTDKLIKRVLARRINWAKLLENPRDAIRTNNLSYETAPLMIDVTAVQILNAVDYVNRTLPGIRGAYDILCEFAHPNLGVSLAFQQNQTSHKDKNSVLWNHVHLSHGKPVYLLREMSEAFCEVFSCIAAVLRKFEHVLGEVAPAQRQQLQLYSAKILRKLLIERVDIEGEIDLELGTLLDPYGPCPCGSNQKYKFCCNAKQV